MVSFFELFEFLSVKNYANPISLKNRALLQSWFSKPLVKAAKSRMHIWIANYSRTRLHAQKFATKRVKFLQNSKTHIGIVVKHAINGKLKDSVGKIVTNKLHVFPKILLKLNTNTINNHLNLKTRALATRYMQINSSILRLK